MEAPRVQEDGDHSPPRRCFTWGCGDYGALGHGVQADEYFPRSLVAVAHHRAFRVDAPDTGACGAQCTVLLTERGHAHYVGRFRNVGEATMRPQLLDVLSNNGHVVTGVASGSQTLVCCTQSGATVSWGSGPYGELGYGPNGPRSSTRAKFVSVMDACRVTQVKSGYGHTLFLVREDDQEDRDALKKLSRVEEEDVKDFESDTLQLAMIHLQEKEAKKNGAKANAKENDVTEGVAEEDPAAAQPTKKKRKKAEAGAKGKKKKN